MKDIIDCLLPYMSDPLERRALVETALFGCPVLAQVNWSGPALTFTTLLVKTLLTFGECSPGKPALGLLLETLRGQVGADKRACMDSWLRLYGSSAQGDGKMDAGLGFAFLLKVGEWAMTELKERWTLRRKSQEVRLETVTEQELEQKSPELLADIVQEKGQANTDRVLARIADKQNLIEGWKDALVADLRQQQLGDMTEAVLKARERNFKEKIAATLREIEGDLGALGFTVEKSS